MNNFVLKALVASALVAIAFVSPASAQATRTWVSGVGDDANPCSRTAPCKTYAGAISKTATNGEINCLDPGGFGSVTITKSLSIVCDYTEGGVLAAGTFGFNINAPAGSIITLKGQDVECVGTGTNGIQMVNVGVTLHIHKVQTRSCRASGGGGNGISITPSSGQAEVFVADSYITDNGSSGTTGGIVLRPTGSGSVNLTVDRTQIENNALGIRSDASATSGSLRALVRNSSVSGNANNGIAVVGGAQIVRTMVDNVGIFGNGFGLVANGAGSAMQVGNSAITGNGTGVLVTAGSIFTYGTNKLNGNITTDGAFTSPAIGQQ